MKLKIQGISLNYLFFGIWRMHSTLFVMREGHIFPPSKNSHFSIRGSFGGHPIFWIFRYPNNQYFIAFPSQKCQKLLKFGVLGARHFWKNFFKISNQFLKFFWIFQNRIKLSFSIQIWTKSPYWSKFGQILPYNSKIVSIFPWKP